MIPVSIKTSDRISLGVMANCVYTQYLVTVFYRKRDEHQRQSRVECEEGNNLQPQCDSTMKP